MRGARRLASFALLLVIAASQAPERTRDTSAPTIERSSLLQRGVVSYYGHAFNGRLTASGEPFDVDALTMAHRTLPFGTRVRITNLANQRSVDVVVNDRGPFIGKRIADLSLAAARRIDMVTDGVVEAELSLLAPAAPG